MEDVRDKVAFVTGGDSGIGLGISRAFLNAGMSVVMTYRTPAYFDEAMSTLDCVGGRVHGIELDVTDRTAVSAAVQEALSVFGKLHILVNNAGVAPLVPLSNATFDDYDWCMRVNVDGVFNCIRALLPHMKAHGERSHIVTTASMVGGLIAGPYWGVYSTSKFAVVGMMEALRSEMTSLNIGVSLFCPASVASRVAFSERNRPRELAEAGKPDADQAARIDAFHAAIVGAILECGEAYAVMEPIEAGEILLRGILRNDLYILTHPEYARAVSDRCEALIASIEENSAVIAAARVAVALASRNSIYIDEFQKRMAKRVTDVE